MLRIWQLSSLAFLAYVLIHCITAYGQTPASQPAKSPAEIRCQQAMDKASQDYWNTVISSKQALAADLQKDLDAALAAKNAGKVADLDAKRKAVLAEIAQLRAGQAQPATKTQNDTGSGKEGLIIRQAVYGSETITQDVTALVRSQTNVNGLQLQITDASMAGRDLDPGKRKMLHLLLSVNGKEITVGVQQGSRLTIGAPDQMPKVSVAAKR